MRAMTPNDWRRLKPEVKKAVNELFERKCLDHDTYILWILWKRFGFGPVRLKRFFDGWKDILKEMDNYEDLTAEKMREALKRELGVDLNLWEEKQTESL